MRLPDGAELTPVSVADGDSPNLSVTPVSLQRSSFSTQQRIAVTAGVVNHGTAAVQGVEVTLELGGRAVQTQRVNVEAGGSTSTTFDPVTVAERNMRASVRLPKDALERDNVFNFVVSPDEPVRVMLVDRPGASREQPLPVACVGGRRVAPSRSCRGRGRAVNEDPTRASVVVLNDVPVPSALAERLARFVDSGGGLPIVTGDRASWSGPPAILPGPIGNAVDRKRRLAGAAGALEYGHRRSRYSGRRGATSPPPVSTVTAP